MSSAQDIAKGGTGQTTAPGARKALGLELGVDVQPYDPGLAALAAFNTNGFVVQTADNTFAGRTITGTAAEITVTNGNGVSANPVISLPAALTFTGKTVTGGTFNSGAFNGTVGATTPSTGSFTTLNSTGGALNGTIGATTPSTGAFTNITASGTLGVTGTTTLETTNVNDLITQRHGTSGTQTIMQAWGYSTNNIIWRLVLEGGASNQMVFYAYDEGTGAFLGAPLQIFQDGILAASSDVIAGGGIGATGNIGTSGNYFVDSVQVVSNRNTGWAADTGTATKTSTATYTAVSFGATYNATVQGQLNTLSTAVQAATRSIKAIKDALITHGLIGA